MPPFYWMWQSGYYFVLKMMNTEFYGEEPTQDWGMGETKGTEAIAEIQKPQGLLLWHLH